MKSYETEFKGTFITVRKDAYGLDAVLTYPDAGFEISDQENTDKLFSRVFDSIEAGETLARAIRKTSAVIVRVKEGVEA
jgi:hypothetical protein